MTQPCLTDITARIQELPAISGVTLDLLRSLIALGLKILFMSQCILHV